MDTRLKNGFRNIISALINRVALLLLPFAFRTVIVYTMGSNYLGLNTVFNSIISVLGLSELGFGAALVYSMYEPVANQDKHKICALLNLYKKIYKIVGLSIVAGGTIMLPFIPHLINSDIPQDMNIYILYYLYLLNTAASYFFLAHKRALLMAYQRNDIIYNISTIVECIMYATQICVLYLSRNYYIVLIVLLGATIIGNLCIAISAGRLYPEITCCGGIDKKELGSIWQHVKGIALQKISSASRNSLDSIIISMNLGLLEVAKYGNYYTLLNAVHVMLYQIPTSILSSVGNSVIQEDKFKNFLDYRKFNFIYMWISGIFICCTICVCQPFMELWMGQENVFPIKTLILFCIYFYELSMVDMLYVYRDAAGLWWHGRFATMVEAVLNLFLNVILGYIWGVNGVLIATIVTVFLITISYYAYIIFKYYFGLHNIWICLKDNLEYTIVCASAACISYVICTRIHVAGGAEIRQVLINGCLSFVVSNCIFWLILKNHHSYMSALDLLNSVIKVCIKRIDC